MLTRRASMDIGRSLNAFSREARSVIAGSRGFFLRAFSYAGDSSALSARLTVKEVRDRLGTERAKGHRDIPRNMSLRSPFRMHVRGFRSWLFKNLATAKASGFGGPGVTGCG